MIKYVLRQQWLIMKGTLPAELSELLYLPITYKVYFIYSVYGMDINIYKTFNVMSGKQSPQLAAEF
jgi:hypothetical protein